MNSSPAASPARQAKFVNTSMTTNRNQYKLIKTSVIFFFVLLESCLTGGTHGSIKSYKYPTSKYKLQRAVEHLISVDNLFRRDTGNNYMVDKSGGGYDTIFDNGYNDGERYITFQLKVDGGSNEYTIHYLGDKEHWDTATYAELSVVYAYDKEGHGGSEGNGGINWYDWRLKKRIISPFEEEFIFRVDQELNLTHVVTK